MRKFFAILLMITLVFTFTSCGGTSKTQTDQLTPTETADKFLAGLKAKDLEAVEEYYEGDIGDLTMLEEEDEPALADVINAMVDKIFDFDYVLGNEKIDGDSATVEVELTTYDFGGIIQEIMGGLMEDAFALKLTGMSQEEMEAEINELIGGKFKEALDNAAKDHTIKVPMELTRKDGKWVVKDLASSKDFLNALSGGLMELADSLQAAEG